MESYLYRDLYELETDHWWHIAKRRTALALLRRFSGEAPKILDVGCGTGQNLLAFRQLGSAAGIDVEAEAIKFCRQRGLKDVRQGSSYDIPAEDNSYDVITLLDVLEHTDDHRSLREIFRALKPGGVILISVPAFPWLWSRWDEVLHHRKRYTKRSLLTLLRRHGFQPLFAGYAYSFLLPPVWIVRRLKSLTKKADYGSDFTLGSAWSNRLLGWLADQERPLLLRGKVPFGTSIFAVARKPYDR